MKKEKTRTHWRIILLLSLMFLLIPVNRMVAQQQTVNKTVTMNLKSTSVDKVFAEIKKQTGLNFIYNADLEKTWPLININVNKRPVLYVLDQIMDNINCTYKVEGNIVTVLRNGYGAMNRSVSGMVRDRSGEPLVGVPVRLSGTDQMTLTDSEGRYSMKIPEEACKLRYSYLGMENVTLAVAAGNTNLHRDIIMNDDNQLEEVVVTGYQTISKERTTGAFNKIDANTLNERPTSDLSSALQGLVAGMQATENEDGSVSFKIRGQSTLYADASPLVVVDGFPIEGSFSSINPNDVESI